MSNDVQFESLAEVDSFAESTNSSLNYLILEASGRLMASGVTDISVNHTKNMLLFMVRLYNFYLYN